MWTSQPSGTASSPCRDRRRTTPAPSRRRARGGARRRAASTRTRRGTRCGRPAPGRHRARSGSGTSRTGAWRRWRLRSSERQRSTPDTPSRRRAARPVRPTAARRQLTGRHRRRGPPGAPLLRLTRVCSFTPRDVGGQHERRDLTGRAERAATASAASLPTSSVLADQRMKRETLRATVSMSDSSCASYCLW